MTFPTKTRLCREDTLVHVTGESTWLSTTPKLLSSLMAFELRDLVGGLGTLTEFHRALRQRPVYRRMNARTKPRRNDKEPRAVRCTPAAEHHSRRRYRINIRLIHTGRAHRPMLDRVITLGRMLEDPGEKYPLTQVPGDNSEVVQHSGMKRFISTPELERRSSGGQ